MGEILGNGVIAGVSSFIAFVGLRLGEDFGEFFQTRCVSYEQGVVEVGISICMIRYNF